MWETNLGFKTRKSHQKTQQLSKLLGLINFINASLSLLFDSLHISRKFPFGDD